MSDELLNIAYLISTFPQCFFLNHKCRRPLKIGILADLMPLVSCGEEELKAVLNKYVRSDGYLLACSEGAIRIDVNGDAAGTVSARHAAHARKVLAERELWRLQKKEKRAKEKARLAASGKQRSEESARTEVKMQRRLELVLQRPVLAQSPEPALTLQQPTPKQGDGFSALKKAAALRRDVAARE